MKVWSAFITTSFVGIKGYAHDVEFAACTSAVHARNPVIADMFTQLDYMEKRGSPSGTTFCRQLF